MNEIRLFTSESVCEGHPDKISDLIADSILDDALSGDPKSRVACEVCCSTGVVFVMGEFDTKKFIDIPSIIRNVIKEIGYNKPEYGFDYHTVGVISYINQQSEDIAQGVNCGDKTDDERDNTGAGDQGMMFGYASNETSEYMPLPLSLAHALTKNLSIARKSGKIPYLRPDGKAQVTVLYENDVPKYVDTVVVSAQHDEDIANEQIRNDIIKYVVEKAIDKKYLTNDTKYFINPTGRFVKGGPHADSGLTGRKIIVDTYGGVCPHGGGSFSGKDPTKVDRSAAYYSRYVCKNIVAACLCDKIELQVAYAIGKAKPVSISINTFGTEKINKQKILQAIEQVFDFRPFSIIKQLDLFRPIYAQTTNYGHMGKEGLPWEELNAVKTLKEFLK
ncbi:MAG: methionine adenosyltransferase [Firmicutes bacterium]|nr:methionine adenosyltransferase [Bacillota bacterium]